MEDAIALLLALVPSEHTRAILGWLQIASIALVAIRWGLARFAPKVASNPWTQAIDAAAQIATMSSKRLADHAHLKAKDPLDTLIAEKGLEVVNRRSLPHD